MMKKLLHLIGILTFFGVILGIIRMLAKKSNDVHCHY